MLMPGGLGAGAADAAAVLGGADGLVTGLGVGGLGGLGAAAAAAGAASGVQQKDTTWTKLFVGGLPYTTNDKSLRDHFAHFGDIEEAVVITDRQTGKSRGYGFVIMADRMAAERACKDPNPVIDGRKANVNLAILGAKPRGNIQPGFPFPGIRTGYSAVLPSQYGREKLGNISYRNTHTTWISGKDIQLVQYRYYSTPKLWDVVTSHNSSEENECYDESFGECNGRHTSSVSIPPGYMYQSPYLTTAPSGIVPLPPAAPVSHAALAAAAAATSQFYEYQNAAAAAAAVSYPGQYPNGFETYPYASAAGAASYVTPYTYATLPQTAGLPTAAAGGFPGLSPYQTAAQATLQEARMQ